MRTRAGGAAHGAAQPGAWPALMFAGRQIDLRALGGPDGNNCFDSDTLANLSGEPGRDVIPFQPGRRARHIVIHGPTALEVAAAARTRAGLEIVQEQSPPASRHTPEQLLDPCQVRVES